VSRIEAISIGELPRRGWNGSSIGKTEECDECPHARNLILEHDERGGEICVWGVAWKRLSEPTSPRKCSKKKREQPDRHVLWSQHMNSSV